MCLWVWVLIFCKLLALRYRNLHDSSAPNRCALFSAVTEIRPRLATIAKDATSTRLALLTKLDLRLTCSSPH